MSRALCERRWQIEAARDGRLASSDLSNALRHRSECADCAQAARALSELARQLKALPVQPTDPLTRRRTRQALLGAWNEHLLAEPLPKVRSRAALIVAFCAIAGVALAIGYPLVRGASPRTSPAATRPKAHSGFEQQAPEPSPAAPSSAPVSPKAEPALAPALAQPHPSSTSAKSRSARRPDVRAAAQPAIGHAEDDAYLQIVELLRRGRALEARTKATQYLALFPNGFRRLEVESIAQRPPVDK